MLKINTGIDISNYTLILPSVAVGNVGQLTIDLFVHTLGLKKMGHFFDSAFIPLVGGNPYDETKQDVCLAVELYVGHEVKLAALQIRSPLTKQPTQFFRELQQFIIDNKIAKVIIFTSSYGYERSDFQIRTSSLRYVASTIANKEFKEEFKRMSWLTLEQKFADYMLNEETQEIPGGGFAKNLFDLLDNLGVCCIILLKSCSEGDNIPDALELANYFNNWLFLIPTDEGLGKFKYPPSWKFLFGNAPPPEIY